MKKILFAIGAFLFFLQITGCSKKIDEAYLSPNTYTKVAPHELLPQIISAMAANYAGHGPLNDMRYVGAYIRNFAFYNPGSIFDAMGYNLGAGDVAQSTWRMHYYDIGQNNQRMMEWAAEEEKWEYVGVGKAIEAWSWMVLTDYYGQAIVTPAFNTDQLVFPYDTEETAYNKIKQTAFEALENLNKVSSPDANFATADEFFYKGNIEHWKKFANGVLARYYNHFSNKASYKPDSAIYYADRAMSTVDEIASVKFAATNVSATNNFWGPFRNNFTGTSTSSPTAIRQNAYIANILNGTNSEFLGVEDPRAWYMLRGNSNGTIVGVESSLGQGVIPAADRPETFFGVSQNPSASNTAPTNDNNCRFLFKNNSPMPILTPTEMKFIKAEAAFRKGDRATALQAYIEGINAHFDMLTTVYNQSIPEGKEITSANKAAYLANPLIVPASGAGLTLSKIMMQKYIAMFGFGILETWLDMRRYHYTDLDPQTGKQVYADFAVESLPDYNNGEFIYRYYPRYNSEYVWNLQSLRDIGATENNYHTRKLWIVEP
ncbi:SusD/RagB family nutrient-binding outer membrane lipoprotein [Niabella insulamsoli]|uniref:SusD/RagB family nutrient-binding outer membrane lipoprotein n=1 Tax=Niabella insulamsoli TaxID=3144874 RepID=UPI0031FE1BCC